MKIVHKVRTLKTLKKEIVQRQTQKLMYGLNMCLLSLVTVLFSK